MLFAAAFILAFLRRSQSSRTAPLGPAAKGVDATDDELARLEAAIRRDGE